jgi:hypothetical protein
MTTGGGGAVDKRDDLPAHNKQLIMIKSEGEIVIG